MISQNRITEIAENEGMGWAIVEKDYFLTLMLDAVANTPELHDSLVFKGGTALRKAYFGDYRYSEDLDFTLARKLGGREIRDSFESALGYLGREHNADARIRGFNSKSWFTDIKIQFAGLKGGKNAVAIDLSADEIIAGDVLEKKILNPYYEKDFAVKVYSLEEILAEKLRSLLQRTRVRDYYDVWYLLTHHKGLDRRRMAGIFLKKVEYKKLEYSGKAQLLDEEKLGQAEAYYERQLANQLKHLPPFGEIRKELKTAIEELEL
ncbi:MAG: nucleotidyl transferase AbiEii/AbiGii toxin family protein [Candidatus Micrarchaeota archaeon]|nr:nucleotidyl transferase AbiEii/AbiGii toxin family protein [Candidatus Micrarchaeota archaeon]